MSPRLADVAVKAGVSEATVSRVLNDKAGVSPATRQAVLAALDILGYERPARLQQRSAGLIGLITPELDNPIFPAFAQIIEQGLSMQGFTAVLCTQVPGGMTEDAFTEVLIERGVAGIVFVSGLHADSTADVERYNRLAARQLPIVLINGYQPGVAAPFVSADDRAAIRQSVSHLVSLGHEKIGLAVGPRRFVPVQRKVSVFVELLGADAPIEHTFFTVEGGHAAAATLIAQGCTAVICGNDLMALGAIRAVRDLGRSVPADVSVIGFDDSPLVGFTDPPLTTVRQPVPAMGTAAVQMLLDELHGVPGPKSEFVFQPELVVRGSTGSGPRVR
ncbi:LacI family DNA-binding transcriptional regulator [Cryptosporangium phraense]|uniref:LacI family DNA-binding transcriptional regulator n=1 Tax=Cryptosporangium phraense TaxID=2593070 RepID=A0A545AZN1_9ACTN|nr:LacI family DNA-binding transcriptional regulator [Cryptosporangium phraense]TQS46790.1 LacI family DNA-binding transcriptional regulator [Cryptosporangium phraense]